MSNPVKGKLSRAWDAFDAYLFDIDGTLLNCTDAVHYFAFCNTLTRLAGRPVTLDGVVAHGNTDVGIMRDALHRANVPEEAWRPRIYEACAAMGDFVERDRDKLRAEALPGAARVLQHLQQEGAKLGVATGNLEKIGRIKLQSSGLLGYFHFLGFSDEFEYRADVFRAAVAKAQEIAGGSAAICVVGDTPADIQAAKANKLEVIAVTTGIYSRAELEPEEPELCISSMVDLFAELNGISNF